METQKYDPRYLEMIAQSCENFTNLKEGEPVYTLDIKTILLKHRLGDFPLGFAGIVKAKTDSSAKVHGYDIYKPCYDLVLENSEIVKYDLRFNLGWVTLEGLSKTCFLFQNPRELNQTMIDLGYNPSNGLYWDLMNVVKDKELIESK